MELLKKFHPIGSFDSVNDSHLYTIDENNRDLLIKLTNFKSMIDQFSALNIDIIIRDNLIKLHDALVEQICHQNSTNVAKKQYFLIIDHFSDLIAKQCQIPEKPLPVNYVEHAITKFNKKLNAKPLHPTVGLCIGGLAGAIIGFCVGGVLGPILSFALLHPTPAGGAGAFIFGLMAGSFIGTLTGFITGGTIGFFLAKHAVENYKAQQELIKPLKSIVDEIDQNFKMRR